jgi:hypothetical protein
MPKKPRFTLATADEIRALLERAFAGLGWVEASDEDDDEDDDERDFQSGWREIQACMDAVRFCASAAGLLGDASLAPLLADIADMLQHRDDFRTNTLESVASALSTLVARGARVAPGGVPPGAPTDPDVRDSRIRLFVTRLRYVGAQ